MEIRIGRSRLPELLRKRRMSQTELARRIGVSDSYISQIINGTSKFSLIKAKMAADVLDCYIDDLYEWIIISKG